jgi:two-component system sensor histidine kinase RegB
LLPAPLAWALAGIAVAAYSWLWTHHIPLSMADHAHAVSWHLGGMWATFAVSATVIAWYITRMNRAMRARDQALANAREQRLRNERVVALANLAAGAAHELGTPLGTMRLLVDELKRDLTQPDQHEDLKLMANQIDQCKEILSRLTAAAGRARAEGPMVLCVKDWLDRLLDTLLEQRPGLQLTRRDATPDTPVSVDVALDQAVRNLVSNAVTASAGESVDIETRRRGDMIDLTIADRGPGMPAGLLETLHHPELRTSLPTEGLGIGLLLTVSSIEHCGGSLEYAPRPGGGTIAHVTIPIAKP